MGAAEDGYFIRYFRTQDEDGTSPLPSPHTHSTHTRVAAQVITYQQRDDVRSFAAALGTTGAKALS